MLRKTVPVLCFILLFAATLFSFSDRPAIQQTKEKPAYFEMEADVCGND